MIDRVITLSIGTDGAEDYVSTFQDISELARNLGAAHTYVEVTASVVEADTDVEDVNRDANTLDKVRRAFHSAAPDLTWVETENIIKAIQTAGILFREHPKNKGN